MTVLRRLLMPGAVALAMAFGLSLPDRAVVAQMRVRPVAEQAGETALRLMLRKLGSTGTFMATTAHPDDEDNGLLAMMGHGRGMRAVLVTATRGDGGQNEIGPELFEALSVLRTEELLAAHRFDGAEQFFTRAVDFGYSFSVEESLRLWGHEDILGDFVRHIRAVRPDVIAGFLCDGDGGGQHHQASTVLTREAYRAAADPARFPEQIKDGLRPWQAQRLFCTDRSSFMNTGGDTSKLVSVPDTYDAVLGRRFGELGIEARSMHKCQGTSQLLPLPGQSFARSYRLEASQVPFTAASKDLFEGIDTSIAGLARFAGGAAAPAPLVTGLRQIGAGIQSAERALDTGAGVSATAPGLASALTAIRALRAALKTIAMDETARFEVEFRLAQKENAAQEALVVSQGLRIEALADDGLVTTGQPIKAAAMGTNNSTNEVRVQGVSWSGFGAAPQACSRILSAGESFSCAAEGSVGDLPPTSPYWHQRSDAARYDFDPGVPFGVPFAPSPFRAVFALTIAGVPVQVVRPLEYRYDNVIAGEKRMEVHVVPPFAVATAPSIAVIPSAVAATTKNGGKQGREVDVEVKNQRRGAARVEVSLNVPQGWTAVPERAPVSFSREDESSTVRFVVTPPAAARAGDYSLIAVVRDAADATISSSRGYDVIEYAHIRRRHLVKDAATRLKIIDVTVPEGLRVGYVMGVGDQVPQAIEQLGAELHLIGPDELAAGDLSAYDVIVTGVRAYERRADLRANNHRLLEYAAAGGTVIVQYNKFEFNQAQYGPFPAKVSANRITDEHAPVDILVPDHPVFNTPNRIGPEAWRGWVQERGLYFLGDRDPRYVDLIRATDPFELNPGAKSGALVEAPVGAGRWIYLGLGLWRQLPAGTDGAYRLLANLLSLGRRR
jgi:LmbE family N-acetylglucosaminyl deacetylase